MIRLLLIFFLLAAAQVSASETFTATVIDVADGDTVRVHADGRADTPIRFGEIDAPEMNQRHGAESRAFLTKLVHGKQVRVELTCKQRHTLRYSEASSGQNIHP